MIENDSSTRHHEVIDESDLELQDEIDNLDIDSSDDQSKPSMALTQMSPWEFKNGTFNLAEVLKKANQEIGYS